METQCGVVPGIGENWYDFTWIPYFSITTLAFLTCYHLILNQISYKCGCSEGVDSVTNEHTRGKNIWLDTKIMFVPFIEQTLWPFLHLKAAILKKQDGHYT